MALEVSTAPASELLTTAEAKDYLRVDITTHDTLIDALIVRARRHAEAFTGRSFINQTLKLHLDEFPSSDVIDLPRPPLGTVTSITYTDVDEATATFSTGDYYVDALSTPGSVVLDDDASWPSTDDRPNAVTIEYVAGYGTASSSVPAEVIGACQTLISHWYDSTGGDGWKTARESFEHQLWHLNVKSFAPILG